MSTRSDAGYVVGCIGAGQMGSALMRRLASAGKSDLIAFDIDSSKTKNLAVSCGVASAGTASECADRADVVILAVKPHAVDEVLAEIAPSLNDMKVTVSVAAGVTLRRMEAVLGPRRKIVRAMPNMPSLVGEGMTVLSPNESVDAGSLDRVRDVFAAVGRVTVLPESLMDAVTGLSGSGPAFVFTFIHALADAGVKLGIPRDTAILLAAQTVRGSAACVLESGDDPIVLRSRVASPGGTTIEGLHVLERSGFAGIVMDAVEQAAVKSGRIGEGK